MNFRFFDDNIFFGKTTAAAPPLAGGPVSYPPTKQVSTPPSPGRPVSYPVNRTPPEGWPRGNPRIDPPSGCCR